MNRTCFLGAVAVALAVALLPCCAHDLKMGEERVVERSGSRPQWAIASQPVAEKKDCWLFRGMIDQAASLDMGLRQAEADAKKRLVAEISQLVEAEYVQYDLSTGADRSGYVADGISWVSRRVPVSGAHLTEAYWERVAVGSPGGAQLYWRVWCLLRITLEDMALAKKRASEALADLKNRATSGRAAEEAARLKERLVTAPEKAAQAQQPRLTPTQP
ncbi:MAG: hypothetical protein V2A77_00485 [Pseudomonadota bacterium]